MFMKLDKELLYNQMSKNTSFVKIDAAKVVLYLR
jgi:hypothetical protein